MGAQHHATVGMDIDKCKPHDFKPIHELTVGGYIDLILERHLEENQEEINGLLRKEIDDWNV